jgi:hypothetical protein
MTREELIERAANDFSLRVYGECDGSNASDFAEGAEWADSNPAWIMCDDRLPEDGEQVYCYMKSGSYEILVWNEHYEVWDDAEGDDCFCDKDQVLAWFELPEFNPIKE